jgi:hypothetical protein
VYNIAFIQMNADAILKNDYVSRYQAAGEQRFYHNLLSYAVNKLIKIKDEEFLGISPELEFLEHSESFLFLYRRESDPVYLELSRVFRRAANKIYRMMLKKGMTQRNSKFLNVV